MNVVFLDRDGTLIAEPPDYQIDSLEKLALLPGVIRGLLLLVQHGFELVMVSNQDRLGTPDYPSDRFDLVQGKLLQLFQGEGIRFSEIFICPHGADEGCRCRKPETALLDEYLNRYSIDMTASFVVGDRRCDIDLGRNIGCRAILLASDRTTVCEGDIVAANFLDACRRILQLYRGAHIERKTSETAIVVDVALDGVGRYEIDTGIGFFDHMLAQLARHSGIDMTVSVRGDLHVDEHHTVEDTGIVLGQAIASALGEKRGIGRYGFILPMDEAICRVALDLSGRPFLAFDASFQRERVGNLPTELVEEFFRAFCNGLGATLHIRARGKNDHHRIEAIFKAVARSLRQAVALDERTGGRLPTTKGVL